jgi:deazaflavin-dependent oxidoreductase (nitroreductase family)
MPNALRYVDATRPPGPLRRAYSWVATTRPLLFLSRVVSWKLDPVLLRVTRGRVSSALILPVAVLETRGARTGERRQNAVVYWHDGESVIIAASQAGSPRNPAWYHNAVANGEVTFGGQPMHLEEVADATERDRLWVMGDRVFPAFVTYRRRAEAAGRSIPLLRLAPAGAGAPRSS